MPAACLMAGPVRGLVNETPPDRVVLPCRDASHKETNLFCDGWEGS